jgi:regulation of enolase protein 1 (concanavalin A-like superfamily)
MLLPLLLGSQLTGASDSSGPGAREKARSASGSVYDDEFNGTSLDGKWGWFNPPQSFDVGNTTPGQLHMVSIPNVNFGPSATSGTILYQNMSGNFTLETKVSINPQNGVEKVGIMLYESDTDWASVKYQVDGGICVEVGVQDPSGFGNYGTTSVSASPMWLRMVKSGTALSTFYSTDGAQWNWVFDWNQSFDEPFKAGLMIADGYAIDNFSADFDYFHLKLPNQPPGIIAPFLPVTFNEDEKYEIRVFDHFYDPDGDNITFKVDAPHIKGSFNSAINDLEIFGPPNWFGNETVQIKATDPDGLWVGALLNVTVLPVEDPPILNRSLPNVMVPQNGTNSSLNLSRYFLDNDTIFGGDILTYGVYDYGSIMVNITPAGKVTLAAPIDFWGVRDMTFTATDNAQLVASGQCQVTVVHVDQAPQVVRPNPPNLTVDEDASISTDFSPVFWDPDGDPITLIPSGNVHIDVIQPDGTLNLTFTPKPDDSGFTEAITVTARDDQGVGTNCVLVHVTVTPVNDPPRITKYFPAGDVVISENQSQEFNVTAWDPENGTALDCTWYLDGGLVELEQSDYVYRTGYASAGRYTVMVSVSDGELVVKKSWNVTVQNVNRAPYNIRILSPKPGDSFKEPASTTLEGSATDLDGDELQYTWFEGYKELGEGRTLSLAFPAGSHAIALQVSDGIVNVESPQLWFTVTANAPPKLLSLDPFNGQEFVKGANIHFKAEAMDTDGDALMYCWTEKGKPLSMSPEFYESDLSAGSHMIHLTISDGKVAIETYLIIKITQPPASGPGLELIWGIGGAVAAIIAAVVAVILLRSKKPPAIAAPRVEESGDGLGF